MSTKYVDIPSTIQVIGCVYNNPHLLTFTDKYNLTDSDFPEEFHRVAFGIIYNLFNLGVTSINLTTIDDFLETRPKIKAIYDKNKGDDWFNKVSEVATADSFDYYYGRLKKMTLLRAYDKCGIDVTDIYDPDNILDAKKKQIQESFLDNSTLEQIALQIDARISEIRSKYVENYDNESAQAATGIRDLVENLKKNPEVGIPLYGSMINSITRGARLGKFYLRSAPTGTGKAIPNNTIIPTPMGPRRVDEIKLGDYLFGQDGKPTKVLAIYPQLVKKQIYQIEFLDGRIAKCCEDHLWEYRYDSHRGFAYRVEDTKTILKRTKTLKNGFKNSENRGYRFQIRLNQAVEYPYKNLSLDPYVMGALLGDGSFRYAESQKALTFSSADEELPNIIATLLGNNQVAHKSSDTNYNYTFKLKNNLQHNLWVEEILKDYPNLWNNKSEDKYIEKDYLYSSISQRYALLQGLLDTDGSIDEKGRVSFTTVSTRLKDDIVELCRSLGFITTVGEDNRVEKYTTKVCYTIHIQCKKENKPNLFRLTRKHNQALQYAQSNKRSEYKETNAIVNIIPLNEYTEMTCFTVDNADHLFLMNDFIVTHNTRTLVADACNFACNKIYSEQFGCWINNNTSEPTLFITTEQDLGEVQTMMLAFLADVDEDHILNGKYEGNEEQRVQEAITLLENSPLYVEMMPDFSLQDIENTIIRNIRDRDVTYVCLDYIHTSMKILEEITRRSGGVKLREDNILFMLSIRLKDICNKYGIFLISATQLNSSYVESETPDQNLLRGAKSIADS